MADFCTRIELHDATWQDYDNLHKAMERAGFTRTHGGFQLPTAEYWLVANLTADQVREKAKAIAASVKPNPDVLVVHVQAWSGYLTPLRKAG